MLTFLFKQNLFWLRNWNYEIPLRRHENLLNFENDSVCIEPSLDLCLIPKRFCPSLAQRLSSTVSKYPWNPLSKCVSISSVWHTEFHKGWQLTGATSYFILLDMIHRMDLNFLPLKDCIKRKKCLLVKAVTWWPRQ